MSKHNLFLLLFALICSSACSSRSGADTRATSATPEARPQINEEKILRHLIGERVRNVPDENKAAEPISWSFDDSEPKELIVVEKQMDGDKATVVIDIKTRSKEGVTPPRHLAGRLRLHYELHTDLIFRKWEIVKIDNISMKYRKE